MTNSQNRQTQKTGFINNDAFTYNELVTQDVVQLQEGDTEIHTDISIDTVAKYIVLKIETIEKGYAIEDHPTLISSQDSSKITISLPVINEVQDQIPYTGQWTVKFYNNREAERQSLSDALRPRSDN